MAFPWEVEALRKVLDTILEKTDAMEPWEKRKVRSDQDEAYIREVSGRGPDEKVPDNLMVDEQGNIWDWEEHFKLSEKERARSVRDSIDAYTKRHEIHEKGDKLKLDWVNEILQEFQEEKAPEVINLGEGKSDWDDMERYLRGIKGPTIFDPEIEPRDIYRGEMGYLRGESTEEFNARMQKEQEEAWARGEVEEEFDDWLKRTQEMEKKPDLSPFLSHLIRQSPYARLPVAGLLGLGLMGYSKPAY